MNTELAEAKAALSRIAAGTNHAGDIRAVRVAIERLDALSTPPADDVREALADESDFTPSTGQVRSHYVFDQSNVWRPERGRAFDRWLAAEVRPRGTVTDTEALAKAWDEGFTLATRNSPNQPHPLAQSNPYRGEARS